MPPPCNSATTGTSPDSSFTLAYHAIRQCVSVHLNANGLRSAAGEGSHRLMVEYAIEAMADIVNDADLRRYDSYRPIRHNSEYPSPGRIRPVTEERAAEAVETARRFFKAVADYVSR